MGCQGCWRRRPSGSESMRSWTRGASVTPRADERVAIRSPLVAGLCTHPNRVGVRASGRAGLSTRSPDRRRVSRVRLGQGHTRCALAGRRLRGAAVRPMVRSCARARGITTRVGSPITLQVQAPGTAPPRYAGGRDGATRHAAWVSAVPGGSSRVPALPSRLIQVDEGFGSLSLRLAERIRHRCGRHIGWRSRGSGDRGARRTVVRQGGGRRGDNAYDVSRHVVCWVSWFRLVEFLASGD
jgi:hypothetical protein